MQVEDIVLFLCVENGRLPRLQRYMRTIHEVILSQTATDLAGASCRLSSASLH